MAPKQFNESGALLPVYEIGGLITLTPQVTGGGRLHTRAPSVSVSCPSSDNPGRSSPALLILNNIDQKFEKGIQHHDELIAIDRDGIQLWKHAVLNQSETIGGTHRVSVDRERNRVYALEDVDDRLLAFDLAGHNVWLLEKIESSALAVDPANGNIWVTGGRRRLPRLATSKP